MTAGFTNDERAAMKERARRRHVAGRFRARGVDRRRRGKDRCAREESGELRTEVYTILEAASLDGAVRLGG